MHRLEAFRCLSLREESRETEYNIGPILEKQWAERPTCKLPAHIFYARQTLPRTWTRTLTWLTGNCVALHLSH